MQNKSNSETEQLDKPRIRPFRSGFLFFAGVLLPAISFLVEITTGWCAETFFDPMPTWWHALLVAFVPVTNFQTWRAIKNGRAERLTWLGFANSLVIFISLYYSIIYAPLLPLAIIALVFLLGVLPMTPFFALLAAIMMRRRLQRLAPEQKSFGLRWRGLAVGLATILILVSLFELPFALTRIGMQMATADDAEKQAEGLRFLQRYGSQDYLLRKCYFSSGMIGTEFVSHFLLTGNIPDFPGDRAVKPEKAREIYYRLHGKTYNSAATPPPRGTRDGQQANSVDFSDEPDAAIGGINKGLSLAGSTIDGSVDGDAALSYLEWTIVFKNKESWQQEAVANIQLPPGGAVSRLTLWINDEEREAAFAGRERVTAAYNAVTARRRDPVLVTTAGKDRIAVRAFPVPPNGGEMKVRIGITAPLVLENENSSLLRLPYFNERNFSISAEHAVWIESKKRLETANPAFALEQRSDLSAVRGKIKNQDLSKTVAPVRAFKSADAKIAWTWFGEEKKEIVRQEIVEKNAEKPAQLIFVVDTSAKMKDFKNEIVEAIKTLPNNLPTALVLTNGNGLNLESAAPKYFAGNSQEIVQQIENAIFGGGADSVAALETAYELADRQANSAIVWIHAPQPLKLSSADALKQRFRRRPTSSAPVYSLQTQNGANAVEKELDGYGNAQTILRFGGLRDDLTKFFAGLNQTQRTFAAVRKIEKAETLRNVAATKETSKHLSRLWANEEVARLLQNNEDHAALELSVKNQLVTPVSGAVVLETKEQYDQFGLKPVDSNTVPTIPEPEEYLLFAIVLAVLAWLGWRYRLTMTQRARGAATPQ